MLAMHVACATGFPDPVAVTKAGTSILFNTVLKPVALASSYLSDRPPFKATYKDRGRSSLWWCSAERRLFGASSPWLRFAQLYDGNSPDL